MLNRQNSNKKSLSKHHSFRPFRKISWITGSALVGVVASTATGLAQTTPLFSETFEAGAVGNAAAWSFGTTGASDPPCLTAAPMEAAPPTSGSGTGIPGCIDTTTGGAAAGGVGNPLDLGAGVLRLTPSKGNGSPSPGDVGQATFVILNQTLPSVQGLAITFEFFAYNGTGADGISFFLLDGSAGIPTTAGAFGGSLGYAQALNTGVAGIAGGYLGVGLDEFGNFARQNLGGTGAGPQIHVDGVIGPLVTDSVALRGSGSGLTGYQLLANSGTLGPGIDDTGATNRTAARRQAQVLISPTGDVTVNIDFNDGNGLVNVIPTRNLVTDLGNTAVPNTLRFGFAASTGNSRNIHEIRNFEILPFGPDLSITKTAGSASFTVGTNGTYTLTVSNDPSAGSTTGTITVTDTIPSGLDFVSATGTDWSCSASGQLLTCTYSGAALTPGASAPPITLTVLPTASATNPAVNSASVSTPDEIDTSDNTASTSVPLNGPILAARKAVTEISGGTVAGAGVAEAGEILEYTVTITNSGDALSTGTTLTDAIPANVTYQVGTTFLNGAPVMDAPGNIMPFATGGLVSSTGQGFQSGDVGFTGGDDTAVVTFRVQVDDPLPTGTTQIENQGTVGSNEIPNTPIDTNLASLPTVAGPSLTLTKRIVEVVQNGATINFTSAEGSPPEPAFVGTINSSLSLSSGDEVVYRIYYLSNGSEDADMIQICDQIPTGTSYDINSLQISPPTAGPALNAAAAATDVDAAGDSGQFVTTGTSVAGTSCADASNPNGSAIFGEGVGGDSLDVPTGQFGFVEFRTQVN